MLKPEIINVESIEPSGITGLETEENFEQDYRLSQTMIRNSNKVGGVARVAFKSTVYFWSLNVWNALKVMSRDVSKTVFPSSRS